MEKLAILFRYNETLGKFRGVYRKNPNMKIEDGIVFDGCHPVDNELQVLWDTYQIDLDDEDDVTRRYAKSGRAFEDEIIRIENILNA